jgi:hypothetical protein
MLALPSSCVFNNRQGRNSQNSRERRATSTSLVTEDGAGFHNEGLDNVKHKTELRFLPPPSRLATNRAALDFELAHNSGRSLFITVLC